MKRAFFQFHLATLVVVGIVCGILIWANVAPATHAQREPQPPPLFGGLSTNGSSRSDVIHLDQYGWPMIFYDQFKALLSMVRSEYSQPFESIVDDDSTVLEPKLESPPGAKIESAWDRQALLVDLLVNAGIILVSAGLCELWMRQRGKKRVAAA